MPKPKKKAIGVNASLRVGPNANMSHVKPAFLEEFKKVRFVTQAAEAVGISRALVYQWRNEDPVFLQEMDEVEHATTDRLRKEALERAMGDRKDRPPSDFLLERFLRARAPEFRENLGAVAQVNVTFVQLLVGKLQTIIQKVVPVKCPHCEKPLDVRPHLAAELSQLDTIDVTATAPEGA